MTLTDPRLAYDSLPVLVWTAGADGTCDYLNERWSEFTGLPVADLLGWGWLDRVHPDDRERIVAEYNGAVAAHGPVRLGFRMLHRNGEYHWLLGTGEPCHDPGGQFLGYGGCTIDVTDFNNLLTGLLGHVALLQDEGSLGPQAREDQAQIRQAADRGETILLVEEDTQVREVSRTALEREGYLVLAVGDAEAAIAAADRHPGHIHLLVTDVVLPRVSGRELAARLAIHRPAIKVLYVSGTSDGAIARHRMLEPGIEFLEKPFSIDRLVLKVRQVLGADLSAEDVTPWTQRSLA